jgi:hypothetical protein
MVLVSTENIAGSDKLFIVGEKSFKYSMKRLRIDPWETPPFTVSQFEKKICVLLRDFYLGLLFSNH